MRAGASCLEPATVHWKAFIYTGRHRVRMTRQQRKPPYSVQNRYQESGSRTMHTCIFRRDRQACQREPIVVVVKLGSEDRWPPYLECGESVPDASLVDAKDCKVLWFDLADVRFINNGKCTAFYVIDTCGMELDRSGSGARPVPLTNISAVSLTSLYILMEDAIN